MSNLSPKTLGMGVAALVALGILVLLIARDPATSPDTNPSAVSTENVAESQFTSPDPAAPVIEGAPPQPEASVSETPAEATAGMTTAPETAAPVSESAISEAAPAETPVAPAAEQAEATQQDSSLLAAPEVVAFDLATAMQDRVIGSPDAAVTIIEYASMTCHHCAEFHNTVLAGVKEKLLSTGKARLIFRDFPLDNFALKAAMMARCAAPEKYFDLVEVIFKNQDRWTKSEDPLKALTQLGALAGMNEDYIKSCMDSVELQAAILKGVQDAQSKYNLSSTPSFYFNDGAESFTGSQSVEKFEETVNKLGGQ